MDKYMDLRFERLEKALSSLVESVSKYNPSTTQANELANADRELAEGLIELQAHQNNHLRIQSLRKQSAALDQQIKETLMLLASTRREIKSTTMTPPPRATYPVRYDELLSYARRISKTTLPPPGVTNGVDMDAPADPPQPPPPSSVPGRAATTSPAPGAALNGTAAAQTPTPASPAINGTGTGTTTAPSSQQPASQTSMPDVLAQHLNPMAGTVFLPWPHDDQLRLGALAQNQRLAEQGRDLAACDPAAEAAARARADAERRERDEAERRDREDRERRAREEHERLRREQAERDRARQREAEESYRRGSVAVDGGAGAGSDAGGGGGGGAGPGPSPTVPRGAAGKQFQFMGGMDDEDDDDE